MNSYKIEFHEVTGVNCSRYFRGQIVKESDLIKSTIESLISVKAISLIEEKKLTKKD